MKPVKVWALLILTIGLSRPLQAAQTRVVRQGDERLKDISAVDVVIDPMPADSVRCGLSRETLQQTTLNTLKSAGVKATISEKASSWYYTVYVTVTTVARGSQCATSIVTELMAQVQGVPEADRQKPPAEWGSLLVGQMTLIRHHGIVSSTRKGHDSHVEPVLREHLKTIGARVVAANK